MTSQSKPSSFVQYSEYFPEDSDQLRIKLTEMYTRLSSSLNIKDIALYDTVEVQNGQQFYDPNSTSDKRNGFRKVILFGAINTGIASAINHGISGITQCTRIYGTCVTDVPDFRPLPYTTLTALTDNINLLVTPTQAIVRNGATAPNITSAMVVIEYLKN